MNAKADLWFVWRGAVLGEELCPPFLVSRVREKDNVSKGKQKGSWQNGLEASW